MAKQILVEQEQSRSSPSNGASKPEDKAGKGWFKGALGMAVCCGVPILLIAAISFFGLSFGAVASGALSLVALLACPVGMFLMMRVMMKDKK